MTEKPHGTFLVVRSRSRWRLHRRASGGEIQFQPFPCPISPSQHSEFHQDSSSSSFAQLENRAKKERKRESGSSLSCEGAPISCLSFFERGEGSLPKYRVHLLLRPGAWRSTRA